MVEIFVNNFLEIITIIEILFKSNTIEIGYSNDRSSI